MKNKWNSMTLWGKDIIDLSVFDNSTKMILKSKSRIESHIILSDWRWWLLEWTTQCDVTFACMTLRDIVSQSACYAPLSWYLMLFIRTCVKCFCHNLAGLMIHHLFTVRKHQNCDSGQGASNTTNIIIMLHHNWCSAVTFSQNQTQKYLND